MIPESINHFFQHAFLRHTPQRCAVMQPKHATTKYIEHTRTLSHTQIANHLQGTTTYAVPYLDAAGLGRIVVLDIDQGCGGLPAIQALIAAATARGLWAFGQYEAVRDSGYVWVPFDDETNPSRLHELGEQIVNESQASIHGWRIENRSSTNSVTRLPLARHAWTGRRGILLSNGQQGDLDTDDIIDTLQTFANHYHENTVAALPPAPEPADPAPPRPSGKRIAQPGSGMTIDRYNAQTDLVTLLTHYGARPAKGNKRLYHCPAHDDEHASLLISRDGKTCCCLSRHSNCPLAGRQHDAFNVFCIMEGLTPHQALRRLNGLPDDPEPGTRRPKHPTPPNGPQTPPAAPRAAQRTSRPIDPPAVSIPEQPAEEQPNPTTEPPRNLSKAAHHVLAHIQQHPRGYYLGIPTLARLLDLHTRTIQRNLRHLEAAGYIRRIARGREGQTDIYLPTIATPHRDTARGGRHLPPTWNHETQSHESVADKGGHGADWAPTGATRLGQGTEPAMAPPVLADDGAYHGPANALAYPQGAVFVPQEATSWYAAVTQTCAPAQPVIADTPPAIQTTILEAQPPDSVPPREPASRIVPETPEPPAPARPQQRPTKSPRPRKVLSIGELRGRIIAAERKIAKLERGRAAEQRQARAIRRQVEQLTQRLALMQEDQQAQQAQQAEAPALASADTAIPPARSSVGVGGQVRDGGQAPASVMPALTSSDSAGGVVPREEDCPPRVGVLPAGLRGVVGRPIARSGSPRPWGMVIEPSAAAIRAAAAGHFPLDALRQRYRQQAAGASAPGDGAVGHVNAGVAELGGEFLPGRPLTESVVHAAVAEGLGVGCPQPVGAALAVDADLAASLAQHVLQAAGQSGAINPEIVSSGGNSVNGCTSRVRIDGNITRTPIFGDVGADMDNVLAAIKHVGAQAGARIDPQARRVQQVEHADEIRAVLVRLAGSFGYPFTPLRDLLRADWPLRACGFEVGVQPPWHQGMRIAGRPAEVIERVAQSAPGVALGLECFVAIPFLPQQVDAARDAPISEIAQVLRSFVTGQGGEQGATGLTVAVEGAVAVHMLSILARRFGLVARLVGAEDAAQGVVNLVFERGGACCHVRTPWGRGPPVGVVY